MIERFRGDESALQRELVEQGLISDAQLQTATEYQAAIGGRLTDIIRKLGFVSDDRLNAFVARREHMHAIDLESRTLDPQLMAKIPRTVIERHCVLPFRQSPDLILLAISEPLDFQAIEEIQFLTSCMVETALAPRSRILERIHRFYAEYPNLAGGFSGPPLEQTLVDKIADPVVAALARALIRSQVLDPKVWSEELDRG
ncbi:MAG: hypothetical protein AB7O52_18960 [Planctomycetota bacterium]